MVLVEPWYPQLPTYPIHPQPWYPEPYPMVTGTYTIEKIKEVEKKWKEKHIKDVKKGILITFDGDEAPLFIATDDECFQKILDAINDKPKKDKIGTKKT